MSEINNLESREKLVSEEPVLVSDTIYLEGLCEKHVSKKYAEWLNDKDVCRENRHGSVHNTIEMTRAYVSSVDTSDTIAAFAIMTKKENKHIGNISLGNISWQANSGEISIIIGDKNFWGKGIGTQAYKLVIGYAFDMLDLHRLYSGMALGNKGMIKVAENSGMLREGVFKDAFFKDGEYQDVVQYAIINPKHE